MPKDHPSCGSEYTRRAHQGINDCATKRNMHLQYITISMFILSACVLWVYIYLCFLLLLLFAIPSTKVATRLAHWTSAHNSAAFDLSAFIWTQWCSTSMCVSRLRNRRCRYECSSVSVCCVVLYVIYVCMCVCVIRCRCINIYTVGRICSYCLPHDQFVRLLYITTSSLHQQPAQPSIYKIQLMWFIFSHTNAILQIDCSSTFRSCIYVLFKLCSHMIFAHIV